MIKKILIAGLIIGLFTSVGYAEIEKEVDSFSGSITITSKVKFVGDLKNPRHFGTKMGDIVLDEPGWLYIFEDAQFAKIKTSDGTEACTLLLSRLEEKWYFFENAPLEIKINKKIYYLPIYKTNSERRKKIPYNLRPNLSPGNPLYTSALWIVNKTMQKRILKANFIIIRVHYSNQPSSTWEIPSKVLNEWKQIIREKF